MTSDCLATRLPVRLLPDPARVIAQLFVPGHYDLAGGDGRATGVVAHILELTEDEVRDALTGVMERFQSRHRDLTDVFRRHAERIGNRLDPRAELSEERWLLLGATFTHEYAVEAAALCNPSAVALPDQSGVPAGALGFALSVRQIGEGHRSSIGFRTGLVDAHGSVSIDEPGPHAMVGAVEDMTIHAATFRSMAQRLNDTDATAWVLDGLADHFTPAQLEARLAQLQSQQDTRRNVEATVRRLHELAARTYTATYPATSRLAERVLYPATARECNGMEDARFVRFVDDDGTVTYHATYTAFDGDGILQQLLSTTDFLTFSTSALEGPAADNKGMALFPRRIDGRFVALSRPDGATNAITFSDSMHRWPTATSFGGRVAAWEAVQVGNCGPPIETDDGWLVLMHGVGPMRTYSIGAWLLDLDDPTRIIGRLPRPLLTPSADERDGYVPNVVYTCGALLHAGTLLIPYGIGDRAIGFATVALDELLGAIRPGSGLVPS